MASDDSSQPDLSSKAVTARLKRVSQLRALCLSLAEAGRRAGLHRRPTYPCITSDDSSSLRTEAKTTRARPTTKRASANARSASSIPYSSVGMRSTSP